MEERRKERGDAPGGGAGDRAVIRLVDRILHEAIRQGASDVHFEPFEGHFQVRVRVGGTLGEMMAPSPALAAAVTARLKILAELDIAEQRQPQDGRIRLRCAGGSVDLRVSTLPTEFGESVVLRILDRATVGLELSALGLPPAVRAEIAQLMRRPSGVMLVTGPTGSGKTTTLYAALREVNDAATKILTAEDPVEYEIDGLVQTSVHPEAGLTFAVALRAFLRQDPDKILIGEIRDLETATIAIQAALTGHLVLSTLHTNSAPVAVTRLLDLGVEPYLVAAALEAVLAQRLVRAVCSGCRQTYPPEGAALVRLGLDPREVGAALFAYGAGCSRCRGTGYAGRLGLFEWMTVDETLRELVFRAASARDLMGHAVGRGMRTLREEGRRALRAQRTTVEEVLRFT